MANDVKEIRQVTVISKKEKKNFQLIFQTFEMQFQGFEFWEVCSTVSF